MLGAQTRGVLPPPLPAMPHQPMLGAQGCGMGCPFAGIPGMGMGIPGGVGLAGVMGMPGAMGCMPPMVGYGGHGIENTHVSQGGKSGRGVLSPSQAVQQPQSNVSNFGAGSAGGGGHSGGVGRGRSGGGGKSCGKAAQHSKSGPSGCAAGKGGGHVGRAGVMGGCQAAFASTVPAQMSIDGVATWKYGQSAKTGGREFGGGKGPGAKPASGPGQANSHSQPHNQASHSNVFVGNLQAGTAQETVQNAFSQYGQVESCSVMNKGGRTFGFVKFACVQSASQAISAFVSNQMDWQVKMANNDANPGYDNSAAERSGSKGFGKGKSGDEGIDHTNVFVGGLSHECTEAAIREICSKYGNIKSCTVSTKGDQTYGLVEFSTVDEARHAVHNFSENDQVGWDVKMANNDARSGKWNEELPHSNLFVGNLSDNVEKEDLEKYFSKYGTVVSCILHAGGDLPAEGGSNRMYGFIKFATIAAASRALAASASDVGMEGEAWNLKPANNDLSSGVKGWGKGYYWVPDEAVMNIFGGKGAGWVWQPNGNARKSGNEKPEPAPSDNLYVKDLPPGITEEEVHSMFSKVGSVVECRVLRWESAIGSAALVRMASVEMALKAKTELSGTVHASCNLPIHVALQERNGTQVEDHLYIKEIPCTATINQLEDLFARYGTVKWCRIMPLPFQSQISVRSGHPPDVAALVQMGNAEEAAKAIEAVNGFTAVQLGAELGQSVTVRFAGSRVAQDADHGSIGESVKPSNNIYVKGWPVGFPDFLLQSVFAQYGTVVRLRLLENPDPEQPTCAALVQMSKVEEATSVIRQLHGRTLSLPLPPMHVRYAGKDQTNSDNLYLTSLPRNISETSLRQTFSEYGLVSRLRLLQQKGSNETHALVQMSSVESAAKAMHELNGKIPDVKGPTLFVAYANATKRDEIGVRR